ncbi:MAG TPA: S8 family peptidase [Terriglobales bacterium]|nr:S8 family peptidase [Terriglobales bacterium]
MAVIKSGSRLRYLMLAYLTLGATLAFAGPRRISKDLKNQSAGQWVNVIVQYRVPPSQAHLDRAVAKGAVLQLNLPVINGSAFAVKSSALAALAKDPDVAYISLDRAVWATATVTDFYDQAVVAPYAWSKNLSGSGIGVAVIDSGINAGKDFTLASGTGSRIVYNQSFVGGQTTANDLYGHGTHVAGILAGNGTNSRGTKFRKTFMGIADNVNLINLRVLDQNGGGLDSSVIAAIQRAISLKSKYNIRVINLSLGRPVYESYKLDPLCQAVEAAWKAGIVVVVAAGNEGRNNSARTDGYGTIAAPGNDPYAITVGAMKPMGTSTRADDLIASYSSKGPTLFDHVVKPDVVAPGNLVISVLASSTATLVKAAPENIVALNSYSTTAKGTSSYFTLSGTSMATPVVSGAVALLLQKNGSLTPDQVKARLMKSAYKTFPRYSTAKDPTTGKTYTSQYDIFTVGAGYLDIQAALSSTDLAPAAFGSAKSPSVARDKSKNVYLVTGSSILWGGSVTWGTSVVWGTSVLWGTSVAGESILWGSSAPWGSSVDGGYSVLWGTSIIWGTSDENVTEAIPIEIEGEE